jgi:predicted metal-binding protein
VATGEALDAVTVAAVTLLGACPGSAFNRFDGNLCGLADLPDPTAILLSATRLESYAECPHAYFVRGCSASSRSGSPRKSWSSPRSTSAA